MAAVKLRVKDVVNGKLDGGNTLVTQYGSHGEIRLCGTVVSKYYNEERTYGNFVLDDGSDTLVVKFWRSDLPKLDEVEVGDIYDVIGTVDEFNEDKNIQPSSLFKKTLHAYLKFHLDVAKTIQTMRSNGDWKENEREEELFDSVPIEEIGDSEAQLQSEQQYENNYDEIESVEFEEESILLDDDDITRSVHEALTDDGMSKEDIIKKTGHDEIDVMLALKELLEDGEIYEVDNVFKRI